MAIWDSGNFNIVENHVCVLCWGYFGALVEIGGEEDSHAICASCLMEARERLLKEPGATQVKCGGCCAGVVERTDYDTVDENGMFDVIHETCGACGGSGWRKVADAGSSGQAD